MDIRSRTLLSGHKNLMLLLSIWVLVGLAYAHGLDGPLLFDDASAISHNPLVKIQGLEFDDWRVAGLSSDSGPLGRVLPMLTFGLNYALTGGFDSFWLKIGNLIIHLASGAFVFLFSRLVLLHSLRHTSNRESITLTAAVIASGVWMLHPLFVSTVLYAVQRMAQLSTLCVLLGLIVFLKHRVSWALKGALPAEILTAALWLALIGMFAVYSKENGLLLVWLVLLCEVCLFRGEWDGRQRPWLAIAGIALFSLPFIVVLTIFVFAPDYFIGRYSGRSFSLYERVLTQTRVLWQYVSWLVLPRIDQMGFQHDDIVISKGVLVPLTTMLSILGWALTLSISWVFRRRIPLLLFGVLFFLVGHSMESTILPLEMVYEHRNYLPGVGVCLLLGFGFAVLVDRFEIRKPLIAIAGVFLVLTFPLAVRVHTWADDLRLSEVNLRNHPTSSRSNYFYALALIEDYEERLIALPEDEVLEVEPLALSRHFYERMHQEDPDNLAAISMLYYLDERYFPQLKDYVDWLEVMGSAANSRVLQATDFIGLRFLLDCFEMGACNSGQARVVDILRSLSTRYPNRPDMYVLQYRMQYLLDPTNAKLEDLLLQAVAANPQDNNVYPWLITHYSRVGNVAEVYENLRESMLKDPARRRLPLLKRLFTDG